MKTFLRLKHWQLFGLLVGIPIIFQIVSTATMISLHNPTMMLKLVPFMMILFIGVLFGWFYSIATNLHPKLPDNVKMNLTHFKIFFFFPLFYIASFCFIMLGAFLKISSGQPFGSWIVLIILPLHLFAMFCMFYILYFISKTLKSVELQRPVTFSDYAGEFFLIWFFPFGVWFIQPRINKLGSSEEFVGRK